MKDFAMTPKLHRLEMFKMDLQAVSLCKKAV